MCALYSAVPVLPAIHTVLSIGHSMHKTLNNHNKTSFFSRIERRNLVETIFVNYFFFMLCLFLTLFGSAGVEMVFGSSVSEESENDVRKGSLVDFLISLSFVSVRLNMTITYLTIQIIININPSKYCLITYHALGFSSFSLLLRSFHSYMHVCLFYRANDKWHNAKDQRKVIHTHKKDIITFETRERQNTEMNIKFMKFRMYVCQRE